MRNAPRNSQKKFVPNFAEKKLTTSVGSYPRVASSGLIGCRRRGRAWRGIECCRGRNGVTPANEDRGNGNTDFGDLRVVFAQPGFSGSTFSSYCKEVYPSAILCPRDRGSGSPSCGTSLQEKQPTKIRSLSLTTIWRRSLVFRPCSTAQPRSAGELPQTVKACPSAVWPSFLSRPLTQAEVVVPALGPARSGAARVFFVLRELTSA